MFIFKLFAISFTPAYLHSILAKLNYYFWCSYSTVVDCYKNTHLSLKQLTSYLRCEANFPFTCPFPSHPGVGHLSVQQILNITCKSAYHWLELACKTSPVKKRF